MIKSACVRPTNGSCERAGERGLAVLVSGNVFLSPKTLFALLKMTFVLPKFKWLTGKVGKFISLMSIFFSIYNSLPKIVKIG